MLRTIKKGVLQNPIVLAAPMRTVFSERPFTKTILAPRGFQLDTVQKVALGILGVPAALGFLASLFSAQWTLFFITGFMLLIVGLILWIIRLRSGMLWKVTWHDNVAEVEDGRYGPTETWLEPLSTYEGLKRDFGLIPRGNQYAVARRVHGLLLSHPEPLKSILLHADYEPIGVDVVAYYEQQLETRLVDS